MIKFNKIRWKNFLSYGNYWTEIDFQSFKSMSIVGKNGHGKCLDKNTKIVIDFKDEETREKYQKFISNLP